MNNPEQQEAAEHLEALRYAIRSFTEWAIDEVLDSWEERNELKRDAIMSVVEKVGGDRAAKAVVAGCMCKKVGLDLDDEEDSDD